MTDRAVPVKIFSSEVAPERRQYFLKKWCQDERMTNFAIRDIIDWDYYIGTWLRPRPVVVPEGRLTQAHLPYVNTERLGGTVQKIITIPAALQNVENPVPRVVHPPWLLQRLKEHKQTRINSHFFFVKKIGGAPPFTTKLSAPHAVVTQQQSSSAGDKGKDKVVGDIEDGLTHLDKGAADGDMVKFPPKAIVRLHKR